MTDSDQTRAKVKEFRSGLSLEEFHSGGASGLVVGFVLPTLLGCFWLLLSSIGTRVNGFFSLFLFACQWFDDFRCVLQWNWFCLDSDRIDSALISFAQVIRCQFMWLDWPFDFLIWLACLLCIRLSVAVLRRFFDRLQILALELYT